MYSLVNDTSVTAYMEDMKKASRSMRPLRNQHSAVRLEGGCYGQDYFIFPNAYNFTGMKPAVLGRMKIDNYLLSLPHDNPEYDENAAQVKSGGLIDSTNYGEGGVVR